MSDDPDFPEDPPTTAPAVTPESASLVLAQFLGSAVRSTHEQLTTHRERMSTQLERLQRKLEDGSLSDKDQIKYHELCLKYSREVTAGFQLEFSSSEAMVRMMVASAGVGQPAAAQKERRRKPGFTDVVTRDS